MGHERRDHLLADSSSVRGLGEHADEQGLLFVEVEGGCWSATGLHPHGAKLTVAEKLIRVGCNDLGADVARRCHAQVGGQIGVENEGFIIDRVEGESVHESVLLWAAQGAALKGRTDEGLSAAMGAPISIFPSEECPYDRPRLSSPPVGQSRVFRISALRCPGRGF